MTIVIFIFIIIPLQLTVTQAAMFLSSPPFFFGLIAHGVTSNSQYMGLPLVVAFYAVIMLLNWRVKKGSL